MQEASIAQTFIGSTFKDSEITEAQKPTEDLKTLVYLEEEEQN